MATAQILGYSFAMGMSLFTLTVLLGWATSSYNWNANFIKLLILPIIGYGFALGLNSIVQYSSCGTIQLGKIASISSINLVAIGAAILLTLFSAVRSPIVSAIPYAYQASYGGILALSFYMFWAGMFGEAISGGMSQLCPKA
jgi:hypothetical protein